MSLAKRLQALEQEQARLKQAVADLTLDKLSLPEAVKGNFCALAVARAVALRFWFTAQPSPGHNTVKRG
ncbi:MAG: hypothetical protein ABIG94_08865 [Pseudomonadota bacterium]